MRTRTLAGAVAAALVVGSGALLLARDGATQLDDATEVRTVVVRSECDHPVWLFYGRAAPVRPQDAVLLGPRASTAQEMLEGDMVWLLDVDRSVLGNATVSAWTTEVVIDASCRSIAAHDLG